MTECPWQPGQQAERARQSWHSQPAAGGLTYSSHVQVLQAAAGPRHGPPSPVMPGCWCALDSSVIDSSPLGGPASVRARVAVHVKRSSANSPPAGGLAASGWRAGEVAERGGQVPAELGHDHRATDGGSVRPPLRDTGEAHLLRRQHPGVTSTPRPCGRRRWAARKWRKTSRITPRSGIWLSASPTGRPPRGDRDQRHRRRRQIEATLSRCRPERHEMPENTDRAPAIRITVSEPSAVEVSTSASTPPARPRSMVLTACSRGAWAWLSIRSSPSLPHRRTCRTTLKPG